MTMISKKVSKHLLFNARWASQKSTCTHNFNVDLTPVQCTATALNQLVELRLKPAIRSMKNITQFPDGCPPISPNPISPNGLGLEG